MSSEFDAKGFRRALGQFPTGVAVVTTLDAKGQPVGITVSSFNSVSLDPPLILWGVAKNAFSAEIFNESEHFVVNVLGKHQVALSKRFALQGEDKFAGIDYEAGIGGCPVLPDTACCFECRTWNVYDGGDHLIVVGEVVSFRVEESVMPLVFARGTYAISAPRALGFDQEPPAPENGFLSNYLLYQLYRAYNSYSSELYPLLAGEFDVTPEEWRIMTLLADTGSAHMSAIALRVSQPEPENREIMGELKKRGLVEIDVDETARLTKKGEDVARRLIEFARRHEENVIARLTEEQRSQLGASLTRMIASFEARARS